MFPCPHCQANGIPAAAKFHAMTARPAACAECGGLAAEPAGLATGLPVAWVLAAAFAIDACLRVGELWPLPLAVGFMLLIEVLVWRLVPLRRVEPGQARRQHRRVALFGIALLLGLLGWSLGQGLISGWH